MTGKLDCAVQHWLVFDDAARLDATGGGDDDDRFGIVDAGGQLLRGKAAEYD